MTFKKYINFLWSLFGFHHLKNEILGNELTKEALIDNLVEKRKFTSLRLYQVIFATIISSCGLMLNSGAVVIGAMLASPLMDPIQCIGYAWRTENKILFAIAIRSLTTMIVLSIIISFFCFIVFKFFLFSIDPTDQLIARIDPTLLDVFVAISGGFLGVMALAEASNPNTDPGIIGAASVAIGTALIPPICTLGYGLASSQWEFIYDPAMLFFTNMVMISGAFWLIIKYLDLPVTKLSNVMSKKLKTTKIPVFFLYRVLFLIVVGFTIHQTYERRQHNQVKHFTLTEITNSNLGEPTVDINHRNMKITALISTNKIIDESEIKHVIDKIHSKSLYAKNYEIQISTVPKTSLIGNEILTTEQENLELKQQLFNQQQKINELSVLKEKFNYQNKVEKARLKSQEAFKKIISDAKGVRYVSHSFSNIDTIPSVEITVKQLRSNDRYISNLREKLEKDSDFYKINLRIL